MPCSGCSALEEWIPIEEKINSDQNSLLHILFLFADTLPHPRLSLISPRKNTSSNQKVIM